MTTRAYALSAILLLSAPSIAQAAISVREVAVGSATVATGVSPQSFALTATVTAGDRLIVAIAARGTGSIVITAVETLNSTTVIDTLSLDAGPSQTTSGTGVTVWLYSGPVAGGALTSIRVTFTGTPARMTVSGYTYSGPSLTVKDVSGINNGTGTSVNLTSASLTTTGAYLMVKALATEVTSTRTLTFGAGTTNTVPPSGGVGSFLSMSSNYEEGVSGQSGLVPTATINVSSNWASAVATYRLVPSKIVIEVNTPSSTQSSCFPLQYTFRARTGATDTPLNDDIVISISYGNPAAYITAVAGIVDPGCPVCGSAANPKQVTIPAGSVNFMTNTTDPTVSASTAQTVSWVSGGQPLASDTTNHATTVDGAAVPLVCAATNRKKSIFGKPPKTHGTCDVPWSSSLCQ